MPARLLCAASLLVIAPFLPAQPTPPATPRSVYDPRYLPEFLVDGDAETRCTGTPGADRQDWVVIDFGQSVRLRSLVPCASRSMAGHPPTRSRRAVNAACWLGRTPFVVHALACLRQFAKSSPKAVLRARCRRSGDAFLTFPYAVSG
jgi:hypothetical protein